MGKDKWAKVIEFLNTTTANPEKVLNSLKAVYGKNKNSMYQNLRSSWPIDVVYNIYHKTGTTINKTKKIPLTKTIANWVRTQDYKIAYRTFHPGVGNDQWDLPGQEKMMKMKLYKELTQAQHVKNCNDVWLSKSGKEYRKELEKNNGQYPFTNYISKEESDALGPVSSSVLDKYVKDSYKYIFRKFDTNKVNQIINYHNENGGLSRYHKIDYFFKVILEKNLNKDPKRTYKKEKDHGTDISFENESVVKK